MRHVIGALYLLTGLIALCWSMQAMLTGLDGVRFSWLYAAVFAGSTILILGAILVWTSRRSWTEWIPLVGSAMLAAYFFPAIIVTLRQYAAGQISGSTGLEIRVAIVLLVAASLVAAVFNKLHLRAE